MNLRVTRASFFSFLRLSCLFLGCELLGGCEEVEIGSDCANNSPRLTDDVVNIVQDQEITGSWVLQIDQLMSTCTIYTASEEWLSVSSRPLQIQTRDGLIEKLSPSDDELEAQKQALGPWVIGEKLVLRFKLDHPAIVDENFNHWLFLFVTSLEEDLLAGDAVFYAIEAPDASSNYQRFPDIPREAPPLFSGGFKLSRILQ